MPKKLEKIMKKKGPYFIEVKIDPDQTISPKLEFGRTIEDLSPLINRIEFKENMKFSEKKKLLNKKNKFQEIN
jgi:hypothetical protein